MANLLNLSSNRLRCNTYPKLFIRKNGSSTWLTFTMNGDKCTIFCMHDGLSSKLKYLVIIFKYYKEWDNKYTYNQ